MLLTIILIVVIVAFTLGNVLLFLYPSKPSNKYSPDVAKLMNKMGENTINLSAQQSSDFIVDDAPSVAAFKNSINMKMRMLSSRMNSLESSLINLSKSSNSNTYSFDSDHINDIKSSLTNLNEFKNNTDLELIAIKNILIDLSKNQYFMNSLNDDDLKKKIRALAFNS